MAENHYLMDTHTAVASAVLRAYQAQTGDTRQSVIVSTASPYKFGASVLGAVAGQKACDGLDDFACCRALAELTGTREPAQILALPDRRSATPPSVKRTKWRRPCWTR